ncbi:hypothetical protein J6524_09730 [Bradyrhizobium sp. WSM 1738]|uniref:hypothetical protein n=1 Tax=Bradyrhizobium hereditatis TaxID=2821405 RepID=UPI001CE31529|nr:hypothetical protein [Bradyrhizobium hereditatis]MCA6115179.1 hypothetical protein [Bradyrhizobium hereditatis]
MDKFNVTAWSQVSQPVAQEEQTGQPGQMVAFEQQVSPFLSDDLCACYPHLSHEDRSLIESAIRAAFVRGDVDLASGGRYANNLASFANSLGSKGLSMAGLNTNELEAERKAGHNRGAYLPKALDHLRKFRDPDASAEAGSSRKPRGRSKIKNFPNEQLMGGPPPKRRRLLDDEPPHLTVLVDPGELRRPEERLHEELQPQRHAEPGLLPLVNPDHFILDPVQIPPAELWQVLDEEPAGAPFFNVDPDHFTLDPVQFSPGELQRLLDDEPTRFEQQVRLSSRQPQSSPDIIDFRNEQLVDSPSAQVRRLLDDGHAQVTISVDPGELRELEEQLREELQPQRGAEPGPLALIDPEHFTFDAVQFPPAELRQVLDEEPAAAPFFNVDPENFTLDPVQFSPSELQRLLDDEPTRFEQQVRPSSRQPQSSPDIIDFRNEQLIDGPSAQVRRLLDDEHAQVTVSVDPGELRELEEQLREELQQQRGAEPGPLALIDPEHLTFDAVQFPPAEFRQLLDDEPAGAPFFNVDPEHFTFDPVQLPPSEHRRLLNDEPVPNEAGPLPPLSLYAPPGWQHGDQWAPEDLKEGMRLHNVLPSVLEPEKTLTLRGVNYTATIGPPGLEHEIFLRRTI